jgi:response regulator RpfG family c-di-GMP phosphodiesterase
VRQHPTHAYNLLASIPYLRTAIDVPNCYHEKWDSSVYPRGLKDEHVPLAARIFSVVDVWYALLSDHPYRKRWDRKRAHAYIRDGSGTHFNPQVVATFLELVEHK